MNNMKEEKGITLIALVITIIVLLILAGISIAMLTGQDGLFGRATGAAAESKVGEAKEYVSLTINDLVADYYEKLYSDGDAATKPKDVNAKEYVKNKLNSTILSDTNYVSSVENSSNIILKPTNSTENKVVQGSYNTSTGKIDWNLIEAPAE